MSTSINDQKVGDCTRHDENLCCAPSLRCYLLVRLLVCAATLLGCRHTYGVCAKALQWRIDEHVLSQITLDRLAAPDSGALSCTQGQSCTDPNNTTRAKVVAAPPDKQIVRGDKTDSRVASAAFKVMKGNRHGARDEV